MPYAIGLVYSKAHAVDIGDHVFPTSKYDRIKENLLYCRRDKNILQVNR